MLTYYYKEKKGNSALQKFIDNKKLVNYVKMVINNKEFSLTEVGKRMGITRQNLYALLNKENLSFADIQRICDAIDCELHYNIVDVAGQLKELSPQALHLIEELKKDLQSGKTIEDILLQENASAIQPTQKEEDQTRNGSDV